MNPFRWLLAGKNGKKPDVSKAIRRVEVRRRELETIKARLEARWKALSEAMVKEASDGIQEKVTIYAVERSNLKDSMKLVRDAELALAQVVLRLETIHAMGDVAQHMKGALETIRSTGRALSSITPALEQLTDDLNSALPEVLVNLDSNPPLNIITTEEGEEVLRAALQCAREEPELTETRMLDNNKEPFLLLDNQDFGDVNRLEALSSIDSRPTPLLRRCLKEKVEIR